MESNMVEVSCHPRVQRQDTLDDILEIINTDSNTPFKMALEREESFDLRPILEYLYSPEEDDKDKVVIQSSMFSSEAVPNVGAPIPLLPEQHLSLSERTLELDCTGTLFGVYAQDTSALDNFSIPDLDFDIRSSCDTGDSTDRPPSILIQHYPANVCGTSRPITPTQSEPLSGTRSTAEVNRAQKRKISVKSIRSESSYGSDVDEATYRAKRARNNDAVRKSRDKTRQMYIKREARIKDLSPKIGQLRILIEQLEQEVARYKKRNAELEETLHAKF